MRRIVLLVALAAAAGAIGASTARAEQPVIDDSYYNFGFYPTWDEFTYGPGVVCGWSGQYGTLVQVTTEKQREITFADGQALVAGPLKITVSKVVWTGSVHAPGDVLSSISLNISGPGWAAPGADGKLHSTVLLGPSLIMVRGTPGAPGQPWTPGHMYFFTGRVVILADGSFDQQGGTFLDVCAALNG